MEVCAISHKNEKLRKLPFKVDDLNNEISRLYVMYRNISKDMDELREQVFELKKGK